MLLYLFMRKSYNTKEGEMQKLKRSGETRNMITRTIEKTYAEVEFFDRNAENNLTTDAYEFIGKGWTDDKILKELRKEDDMTRRALRVVTSETQSKLYAMTYETFMAYANELDENGHIKNESEDE